jgi:hypothetical protein
MSSSAKSKTNNLVMGLEMEIKWQKMRDAYRRLMGIVLMAQYLVPMSGGLIMAVLVGSSSYELEGMMIFAASLVASAFMRFAESEIQTWKRHDIRQWREEYRGIEGKHRVPKCAYLKLVP